MLLRTAALALLLAAPSIAGAQSLHETHEPVTSSHGKVVMAYRPLQPQAVEHACHPEASKSVACHAQKQQRALELARAQKAEHLADAD